MFRVIWLDSYRDGFGIGSWVINNSMETNNLIPSNKVATKRKLFSAMRTLGYEIPKGSQIEYDELSIYINAKNGKPIFELQKIWIKHWNIKW